MMMSASNYCILCGQPRSGRAVALSIELSQYHVVAMLEFHQRHSLEGVQNLALIEEMKVPQLYDTEWWQRAHSGGGSKLIRP